MQVSSTEARKILRMFISSEKIERQKLYMEFDATRLHIRKAFTAFQIELSERRHARKTFLCSEKCTKDVHSVIVTAKNALEFATLENTAESHMAVYHAAQLVVCHAKVACDVAITAADAKCKHTIALKYIQCHISTEISTQTAANLATRVAKRTFDEECDTITSYFQEIIAKYDDIASDSIIKYNESKTITKHHKTSEHNVHRIAVL